MKDLHLKGVLHGRFPSTIFLFTLAVDALIAKKLLHTHPDKAADNCIYNLLSDRKKHS